ncbi:sushi, von Willebrand factor type A, EGF and pentraxin domain-containing protein 1 [Elysia marginata]|uniref:Sushi, von Willebrand factor type A, EGF and pentraxin domain-containing protein 1 n=1 Tax=Elysia marginata TaxID=1093978 RepID=A0AAV4IYT2_9GAST|nr:sushi, von Willebrand factor type A, EGF and pentraxin domain-containing protein 1 [Elysia marginata]
MTAERFNGFLNHVSEIYQPEMEVCFVFDNARAHMQARNLELPEGFNIKYLPPYSPFLNICENAFSIWKQALKTRLTEVREQTFDQPFDERMATLTQLAVQETNVVTDGKTDDPFYPRVLEITAVQDNLKTTKTFLEQDIYGTKNTSIEKDVASSQPSAKGQYSTTTIDESSGLRIDAYEDIIFDFSDTTVKDSPAKNVATLYDTKTLKDITTISSITTIKEEDISIIPDNYKEQNTLTVLDTVKAYYIEWREDTTTEIGINAEQQATTDQDNTMVQAAKKEKETPTVQNTPTTIDSTVVDEAKTELNLTPGLGTVRERDFTNVEDDTSLLGITTVKGFPIDDHSTEQNKNMLKDATTVQGIFPEKDSTTVIVNHKATKPVIITGLDTAIPSSFTPNQEVFYHQDVTTAHYSTAKLDDSVVQDVSPEQDTKAVQETPVAHRADRPTLAPEIAPTPAQGFRLCKCKCPSHLNKTEQNRTLTKNQAEFQKELSVDTRTLSKAIRRKSSAVDSRVSSVCVGVFGTTLLVTVLVLLVITDIFSTRNHIRMKF